MSGGPLNLGNGSLSTPLGGTSWGSAANGSHPNGNAPLSHQLIQDPATGLYVDVSTGQVYQTPKGAAGPAFNAATYPGGAAAFLKAQTSARQNVANSTGKPVGGAGFPVVNPTPGNGPGGTAGPNGGNVAGNPAFTQESESKRGVGHFQAGPGGTGVQMGLPYDPATGRFTDPTTGAQFVDRGGTQPIAAPDLKGLELNSFLSGKHFNAAATTNNDQFNKAMSGEMSLADALNETIKNVNAPSVAAEQERQALEANQNTQQAEAAGASGENGALARRQAANNTAALGAQDAQTAALRRAQEVSTAQANLGNVLQSAGSAASGMYGKNTELGLGYQQNAGNDVGMGLTNNTNVRGQNIGLFKDAAVAAGSGLASVLPKLGGSTGSTDQNGPASAANDSTDATANNLQGPDSGAGNSGSDLVSNTSGQSSGISSDALGVSNPGVENRNFLTSDRRAKHAIHDENESAEESFVKALHGKTFKYNSDEEEEGERHGVMTDQLKRSKMGRSVVHEGPDGYEGIDVAQGLGAALSALGYLHKRLARLEGKHGDG